MNDTPEQELDEALEASLGGSTVRYLKTLVTAMTVTTVLGLVVLVGVVVMRFSQTSPENTRTAVLPSLPATISLPEGVQADAVTFGDGWVAVVGDNTIYVFDQASGAERDRLVIGE